MPRLIYQRIVDVFKTNSRQILRRSRGTRYSGSRSLAIESLECRKLPTAATLTLNSLSDGSFEAPALAAGAYQGSPRQFPLDNSRESPASAAITAASPSATPMLPTAARSPLSRTPAA